MLGVGFPPPIHRHETNAVVHRLLAAPFGYGAAHQDGGFVQLSYFQGDENRLYHVVTVDYLAEGNDHMTAFLDAVTSTYTGITLRDVMIDWVKEQTRQGKEIDAVLDGRIRAAN